MVKKLFLINKKEGETPLYRLESFRSSNKAYNNLKLTYAGRLDPMAEGLLIILAGEECKKKDKYLSLDKEYIFEVLFGFKTDTFDILGKVTKRKNIFLLKKDFEKEIKKFILNIKGNRIYKYPIYSSKTVGGKPLFSYARSGEKVELPEKEIKIKNFQFINSKKINNKILLNKIIKRISKVKGDFRQSEIIRIWKKNLKNKDNFYIAKFKIKGTSGMYVRNVANELGEAFDMPSLAYRIKRTKIGNYDII